MHTEKFILIPKRMFITKQPQKSEIIENSQYKNKAIQLSLMQRIKLREDIGKTDRVIQTDPTNIERDVDKADRVVQTDPTIFNEEEKMEASSDDSEMDPIVTKKPTVESFESIMKNVKLKEAHKVKRAEIVLDFILQSNQITIGEESQLIYIDNKPTDVQAASFLYDLQQPTKKIDQEAYSRILLVLRLEPDLVSNTYAKQILESYESEQEFFPTQQSPQTGRGTSKRTTTEKEKTNETTKQKKANQKKVVSFRLREKNFRTTVLERSCIVWKLKAITKTQQNVISKSQVLFRYQAVPHKIPLASNAISQTKSDCERYQ